MDQLVQEDVVQQGKVLKQLYEKRRRAKLRKSSHGLGPRAVHAVLSAYVYSEYNAETAGHLAKQLWKRKAGEEEPVWGKAVEDLFLDMSDNVLGSILEPVSELDKKSAARAKAFLAKACLAGWVAQQNFGHGIAPSSAEVEQEYRQILGFHSAVEGDAAMCVHEQRRIRLWVQRWGKQFDVGRGKLQFLEEVPPGQLQEKAG